MVAMMLMLLGVAAGASQSAERAAHDAIVDAVQQRMGAGVEVAIEGLVVNATIAGSFVRALPAPDARLGSVIRFTLQTRDGASTVGSATARITAIVPHVHAARPLDRGTTIAEGDIAAASHVMSSGPLHVWPGLAQATGATVMRALAAGACIPRHAIQAVQAVRTGQNVTAIARIGGVEATAVMVAAGGGDAGAVIRVVNRQSRRALKARVVSAGIVEIIHE